MPEVNAAETQAQVIDDSVTGTSGFDEFADIPTFVRNAADREQFLTQTHKFKHFAISLTQNENRQNYAAH